jgi:putative hydrolase of HD superfamily
MERLNLLSFLRVTGRLKNEKRKGWVKKAKIKDCESVAEHTFRVALISMIVGNLLNLDAFKMVKLALIHDLPEAVIGDEITEAKEGKLVQERIAMLSLLNLLNNDKLKDEYIKLWDELASNRSVEAMIVNQIDAFEMAIQAYEYFEKGKGIGLEEFVNSALKRVEEPTLKEIVIYIKNKMKGLGKE